MEMVMADMVAAAAGKVVEGRVVVMATAAMVELP